MGQPMTPATPSTPAQRERYDRVLTTAAAILSGGGEEALQVAWSAAEYALKQRRVECAFVVSVCFGRCGAPGWLLAWCMRNSHEKF